MKCLAFLLPLLFLFACSQSKKDRDIKVTISATAREEVAFAGVNYIVKEGVVTLSGNCPTQGEKDKVLAKVRGTAGVKATHDLINVAPVLLNADFFLKQAVDSVLKKYARVQASVQDSVVSLQGEVEKEQLPEILKALDGLGAKGVYQQSASE
jgi:osmotically-inducible protein OsmY